LTPLHEIEIDKADNSCLWSEPEQAMNQKLLLHDATGGQAADLDVPPEPKAKNTQRLPLLVGTKVQAARNFGPIKEGTPGIITDVTDLSFFLLVSTDIRVHICREQEGSRAPQTDCGV
jgi:hypothetical protein